MTTQPNTWAPSPEQRARVLAFESWLLSLCQALENTKQIGDFERALGSKRRALERRETWQPYKDMPESLLLPLDQHGLGDQLIPHVADYYFFPAEVQHLPNDRARTSRLRDRADLVSELCQYFLLQQPTDYAFELGFARLAFQIANPSSTVELNTPAWILAEQHRIKTELHPVLVKDELRQLDYANERYRNPFLAPACDELSTLLQNMSGGSAQIKRLFELVRLETPIVPAGHKAPAKVDIEAPKRLMSSASYLQVTGDASEFALAMHRTELLDADAIRCLLDLESSHHAYLFHAILSHSTDAEAELTAYASVALDWVYAMTTEPAAQAIERLGRLADLKDSETALRGARFLIAAAKLVEQVEAPKNADEEGSHYHKCMRMLCRIRGLVEGENEADVVAELAKFNVKTLETLVTYCSRSCEMPLQALGINLSLYRWLRSVDQDELFDATEARAMYQAHAADSVKLCKLFNKAKLFKQTMRRLDAALGVPDKKLDGMLSRFSQEHIRIYGLYPVQDDADIAKRFRYFREAGKLAAKKFGSERTANVRDAATAGLNNLALNAGYADVTELEWAIDARAPQAQLQLDIDGYRLSIEIEHFKPELSVHKEGKALKAVPPALKKHPDALAFFASFETLKDHSKRYRVAIENLMISARPLSLEKLGELACLPIAKSMLSALIFRTPDGFSGLLDDDWRALVGHDGTRVAVSEAVQIAHAMHLLRDGNLSQWQSALVEKNAKQPFKQVFRECYVLTPAERDAGDHSRRFAGRKVRTRVLGATLSGRGWRVEGSEFDFEARKKLGDGIRGQIALPEVYQFLTQEEDTELEDISFYRREQKIPLAEVPELAFSEFMRDLDLVITVGASDPGEHSEEVQKSRIALLSALIPSFKLANVRIEGHFAMITGKRASYRLHLGTAVIHVLPAGYLCVVPAGTKTRSQAALPFVDDDARTSEVISKLLMLAADQKITDESILAQIEGRLAQG